jgi:hypothetical protein
MAIASICYSFTFIAATAATATTTIITNEIS